MSKIRAWRCNKYLDWVKTLSCSFCGVEPAGDAHHIRGRGNLGGTALKAPDQYVMPLCRGCHQMFHDTGDRDLLDSQWQYIAHTLALAIQEGVFRIDENDG